MPYTDKIKTQIIPILGRFLGFSTKDYQAQDRLARKVKAVLALMGMDGYQIRVEDVDGHPRLFVDQAEAYRDSQPTDLGYAWHVVQYNHTSLWPLLPYLLIQAAQARVDQALAELPATASDLEKVQTIITAIGFKDTVQQDGEKLAVSQMTLRILNDGLYRVTPAHQSHEFAFENVVQAVGLGVTHYIQGFLAELRESSEFLFNLDDQLPLLSPFINQYFQLVYITPIITQPQGWYLLIRSERKGTYPTANEALNQIYYFWGTNVRHYPMMARLEEKNLQYCHDWEKEQASIMTLPISEQERDKRLKTAASFLESRLKALLEPFQSQVISMNKAHGQYEVLVNGLDDSYHLRILFMSGQNQQAHMLLWKIYHNEPYLNTTLMGVDVSGIYAGLYRAFCFLVATNQIAAVDI